MSEHIAMLVGAGLLVLGFTLGWNGAFFLLWIQERQKNNPGSG
jgi:hypothetical protein